MTSPRFSISTPSTIRHQHRVVAAFHSLTLLLLGLHLYVYTLPPTPTPLPEATHAEAAWWGLWPITYIPLWLGVLATLLIIGWIVWWWGGELRITNYELEIRNYKPRITNYESHRKQFAILVMVALLLFLSFYLFPIVHTRWGDGYLLSKAIAWPDPVLRLTHSWQAPLDLFLHSQLWVQLHPRFGWEDAVPVYRLLSPLAGFLYLIAAFGLTRDRMLAPRWLTFGLLTSLGVLQLFFGYIENYSFAAAGVLLYLWLGLRTLDGRMPLWVTASALALTHALHPSTLILAPSLLYCGWHWVQATTRLAPMNRNNSRLRNLLVGMAAIMLPMMVIGLAVIGFMEAGGHGIAALMSTDRPGGGDARLFVPLWSTTTRWEHYTLFSWLHLRDFLNEQLLVAPVVLPALVILFIIGVVEKISEQRSKTSLTNHAQAIPVDNPKSGEPSGPQNPKLLFLFLATFCYLLFIWVWNPDYGGQRDWDLFSLAAIPAALLVAAILPTRFADQRYLQAATIPLLMLQWLHLGTWLYQNTLPWEWP